MCSNSFITEPIPIDTDIHMDSDSEKSMVEECGASDGDSNDVIVYCKAATAACAAPVELGKTACLQSMICGPQK